MATRVPATTSHFQTWPEGSATRTSFNEWNGDVRCDAPVLAAIRSSAFWTRSNEPGGAAHENSRRASRSTGLWRVRGIGQRDVGRLWRNSGGLVRLSCGSFGGPRRHVGSGSRRRDRLARSAGHVVGITCAASLEDVHRSLRWRRRRQGEVEASAATWSSDLAMRAPSRP